MSVESEKSQGKQITAKHSNTKKKLRRDIIKKRSALTETELLQASNNLIGTALSIEKLTTARKILSYSASNGEINPQPLLKELTKAEIYLPRISSYQKCEMQFHRDSNKSLRNRYGIIEPSDNEPSLEIEQFDIILMPIVAFDRAGNRLGMGGGYYDRALKKHSKNDSNQQPMLLGVAHYFQEIKLIPKQEWDVTMDAILTDREYIRVS